MSKRKNGKNGIRQKDKFNPSARNEKQIFQKELSDQGLPWAMTLSVIAEKQRDECAKILAWERKKRKEIFKLIFVIGFIVGIIIGIITGGVLL